MSDCGIQLSFFCRPHVAPNPVLTIFLTAVTEAMGSQTVGMEGVLCNPEAHGTESVARLN